MWIHLVLCFTEVSSWMAKSEIASYKVRVGQNEFGEPNQASAMAEVSDAYAL